MEKNVTNERTIRSIDEIDTVVDCDFHVQESTETLREYIREPYDRFLKGATHGIYPRPGSVKPDTVGNVSRDGMPATKTYEGVLEAMELISVDHPMLTPGANLYLSGVQHDELATAVASAYNSWLLDEMLDNIESAIGAILVGARQPSRAAEEIDRRAGESQMRAVIIPSGGLPLLLGNEKYWPIYEAAENNGLPIVMHAASGNAMLSLTQPFQGFNRFLSSHTVSHAEMHMNNIVDMITRGVPVEFPDLEFVIQEAGIGWIPYLMERFDHEYDAKQYDAPMLEKNPSEYIDDQFYFTSQPLEGASTAGYVDQMARMFNAESNLMFSSDYPHFDHDESNELLTSLQSFSDTEVRNIYGTTASELYGI